MLVRNVTRSQLYDALQQTTEQFENNIIFARCDFAGHTRQGGDKHNVTLKVKSSHAPGHRLAPPDHWNDDKQRHIATACWHVHKQFLIALAAAAPQVEVTSGRYGPSETWRAGDSFSDWNVGSKMYPVMLSEACDCTF